MFASWCRKGPLLGSLHRAIWGAKHPRFVSGSGPFLLDFRLPFHSVWSALETPYKASVFSTGCHVAIGVNVFCLVKSLERLPKLVKPCSFPSACPLDQMVRTEQNPNPIVTESELALLAARQANNLRDQVLGQGIGTLLGKPAEREDGRCMSQGTVSPKSEFSLLLY